MPPRDCTAPSAIKESPRSRSGSTGSIDTAGSNDVDELFGPETNDTSTSTPTPVPTPIPTPHSDTATKEDNRYNNNYNNNNINNSSNNSNNESNSAKSLSTNTNLLVSSSSSSFSSTSPLKRIRDEDSSITMSMLNVGGHYDVLDSTNRWCEAEVVKMDLENRRAFVTYIYWTSKYDEWISDIEGRFAVLNRHTYVEGGVLKNGQRLEVMDERGQWIEAYVIEESESQIKVHFRGFHPKFDEWIPRECRDRIRPFGRLKFVVPRRKDAVQWSARSYVETPYTSANSYELITGFDKENMPTRGQASRSTNNPAEQRVRYIGDDSRERKITNNSTQFLHYQAALASQQLCLVTVSGDGNCLFRSVAHQIYGDESLHHLVREKCMDYMESEADFFSQFVVGGKETFHVYLQAKRMNACWGDDPEIEAMCEMYNRPTEIWAYDAQVGAKKLRTFHETVGMLGIRRPSGASVSSASATPSSSAMRLSYYGGGHFDSIVGSRHSSRLVTKPPGEIEDAAIHRSRNRWLMAHSQLPVDRMRMMTDGVAAEQASLDFALQDSRRQQMTNEYDDLETSLMLSIKDYNNMTSSTTAHQNQAVDASLVDVARVAAQDNILESVQKQSEQEYLENILLSSMVSESKQAEGGNEEMLIQHAILESQLSSNEPPDKAMQLALELSNLSSEEALELALKNSIKDIDDISSIQQNQHSSVAESAMSDEAMLQLAMAASLQSTTSSAFADFYGDSEYDEDLMLAIQASLGK